MFRLINSRNALRRLFSPSKRFAYVPWNSAVTIEFKLETRLTGWVWVCLHTLRISGTHTHAYGRPTLYRSKHWLKMCHFLRATSHQNWENDKRRLTFVFTTLSSRHVSYKIISMTHYFSFFSRSLPEVSATAVHSHKWAAMCAAIEWDISLQRARL